MTKHFFEIEIVFEDKTVDYREYIEDPANEYSPRQAFELLCKKIHNLGVVLSAGTIDSLCWFSPEMIIQIELLSYRIDVE